MKMRRHSKKRQEKTAKGPRTIDWSDLRICGAQGWRSAMVALLPAAPAAHSGTLCNARGAAARQRAPQQRGSAGRCHRGAQKQSPKIRDLIR
jgi:hypothetical protein